jgi:hypothetical protein
MKKDILFEVSTPIGFDVTVTSDWWNYIVTVKHPIMFGRELDAQSVLQSPDEIRQSRKEPSVFLFYRAERSKRWICVVAKKCNGEGFVITAYITDAIKEGERIWSK